MEVKFLPPVVLHKMIQKFFRNQDMGRFHLYEFPIKQYFLLNGHTLQEIPICTWNKSLAQIYYVSYGPQQKPDQNRKQYEHARNDEFQFVIFDHCLSPFRSVIHSMISSSTDALSS